MFELIAFTLRNDKGSFIEAHKIISELNYQL